MRGKFLPLLYAALLFFYLILLSGCGDPNQNSTTIEFPKETPPNISEEQDMESNLDVQAEQNIESGLDTHTGQNITPGPNAQTGPNVESDPNAYAEQDTDTQEGLLASPSTAGALQVVGTQLAGSNGEPVQLKGISTHGLAWFPDYVNEDCFAELKNNWNANVIRLAMYTAESGGYCTDGDTSYLKELVRNGIQYAANQDLYVIVDWHILSDNDPNLHVEEAKAFFDEISSEFAQENHILYEICNEPNGQTSWGDIKAYANNVIPVIRANDPDAIIIIGTPNWCQFVDQAAADPITGYDNLMYALHFYAATHKEDLRSRMTSAISDGLPIFVSEYGICDASGNGTLDFFQADQWLEAMNQAGVSYVAWNLSNKNESSAILRDTCSKASGFTQEDLSDSGQWLYQMLHGQIQDTSQNPSDPAASDPVASDPAASDPAASDPVASDPVVSEDVGLYGDFIEVTPSLTGSWENNGITYYQYNLSLKNLSGQACSQWAITLPFSDTPILSDGWNGVYTVQGDQLSITSMDYNGSIPSGGTIRDIGFIVSNAALDMDP